jgi:hypothetical protein
LLETASLKGNIEATNNLAAIYVTGMVEPETGLVIVKPNLT